MNNPRFIHLRIHSDYSMVDGLAKITSLARHALKLGMPSIAITDNTNIFGLIKFYKIAHHLGIKPIFGADFKIANKFISNELTQLTVLATNDIGYQNLILLISRAYQIGYGTNGPTISQDWLVELKSGLILLSGGRRGDVGYALLRGNYKLVSQCITFYKQHFYENYYLELIRTGRPNEDNYINLALDLAIKENLPVVATNEVCFINTEDFDAHEIRVAINNGYTLDDPKRSNDYSPQQYMRSEKEMCALFSDIPEALENTVEIAKRCSVTIKLGKYFLPHFFTGNLTTEDFLIKKAYEGLEERLKFLFQDENIRILKRQVYYERLKNELNVINNMGFPGYYLIVMEFVQWSKDYNIPVGPGRGSGAGSLVSYALKITDIDPIKFDLLFERFLNPERISMPDFDIDFCMEKRDQVIEHVFDKYGRDAVSQIITFGTMTAKAVIRDVGRVLGHQYGFVDRIAKLIPSDPGITIDKSFKLEPKLLELYNSDDEIKTLINTSRTLEGVIKNASKHAGGIVIAPTKITDFTALYCDENSLYPVTQFDKIDIEHTGLVKFDFLGLRTLTIISWALKMINAKHKKNGIPLINISEISLEDKKTFNVLRTAETTAVFQLESNGMKDLIKRLQPDCFEDIIALVALFRPGPLQSGMVDNFINRKHGKETISYPDIQWQHDILKPVLEHTYGIILYQEQVMQIAQVFAGYTLGSADMLRRAMGKKNPKEMANQRSIFLNGAKKNGIDQKLSIKIFDLVEKFAGYGFNKSHSAAYALLSYQTLWLKTHFPAEFMSAVMSADMDNTTKIVSLVDECWRMGLKVLPPDINSGLYQFHVNIKGEIVYGIGAIKGVGKSSITSLINARNNGGNFYELFDLCARSNLNKINRGIIEKLIMSGALDSFGVHRASLMNSLNDALKSATQNAKNKKIGQTDMFDILINDSKKIEKKDSTIIPWSEQIQLEGEHKSLGLYLTGHPINQYLNEIKHYVNGIRIKDIKTTDIGGTLTIASGIVIDARIIFTKRGHRIGVCTLDDRSGRLEIILFGDILNQYQHLLEKDRILIVTGLVNTDNISYRLKMTVQKIIDINEARKKYVRALAIHLTNEKTNKHVLNELYKLLKSYSSGTIPISIYYKKDNICAKLNFGNKWNISLTDALLHDLKFLIGIKNIKLEF